ncbi:hypothetical protein [Tunicatimonas pelagia]|uniref:hypothetical protein n=1 Tax=Tunicatimonas pelagia TaxID=931531 RepID=UPI002666162A|nr:hypothetical protein [Tunicatimonas pelagia]WKN42211.1 hypothetical protein P0M28_24545 [Tunicatimonas pelagia]WKN45329.1 hypothetical protein P0M28_10195 [Tunicatimonas pelagia]
MKKQLYFDKPAYEHALRGAKSLLETLQESVDEINRLQLKESLTSEDLLQLLKNPKTFIVDAFLEKQGAGIAALPLKKEKMIDLLDLPEGCEECVLCIQKAKQVFQESNNLHQVLRSIDSYELQNSRVQVKQSAKDRLAEFFTFYITSERQEKVHAQLKIISEAMNKLADMGVMGNEARATFIKEALLPQSSSLGYHNPAETIRPNHRFIIKK